jgi:glutamine synthetase
LGEVARLARHHDADPERHAAQISRELKPAMERLRQAGDALETVVATELWPMPNYRNLLFLK